MVENTSYCLIPFAAPTIDELRVAARECIDQFSQASLTSILQQQKHKRSFNGIRMVVRASSINELTDALEAFIDGKVTDDVVFVGESRIDELTHTNRLVFVFNGMGTQWNGMGAQLYAASSIFRNTLHEIALAFKNENIVQEMLDRTLTTMGTNSAGQAANFCLQLALLALVNSLVDCQPVGVIGLSAGEPAAAYCAKSLSLGDAALVVNTRLAMQERVVNKNGGMLAVITDIHTLRQYMNDDAIEIAGILAPTTITITGPLESLAQFKSTLPTSIMTIEIPMPTAYHSALMETANIPNDLQHALKGIHPMVPSYTLFSTVTGSILAGAQQDASYWWQNVRQPVLFQPALEAALDVGSVFVEFGPHPCVARSIAAIAKHTRVHSFATMQRGVDELLMMDRVIINLFLLGYAINWDVCHQRWTTTP